MVMCVECRRYAARWLCDDCEEVYCVSCYARVHQHGTKVPPTCIGSREQDGREAFHFVRRWWTLTSFGSECLPSLWP